MVILLDKIFFQFSFIFAATTIETDFNFQKTLYLIRQPSLKRQ